MKIIEIPSSVPGNSRIAFYCEGCGSLMQVCPDRWNWNRDPQNPTLSPSILQTIGPFPDGHKKVCHCFVRDGRIEYCGDCTHSLAGTTHLLRDVEEIYEITVLPNGGILTNRRSEPA